jgi:8-oxo-dGTP pyrophosphatase MutT (NUDIX family)
VGPDRDGPEPERVETVFAGSRIAVEVEEWPNGVRREVVRHPGACAAVVFEGSDHVLLVRQMREAVRRELLEIPAGTRDVPGESPEDTMRREILEETGRRVGRLEGLGRILTTPGFTDELMELYVAWAEPNPGDASEAGISTMAVPFDDAVAMVLDGRIEDAKSCVALLLAKARGFGPDHPA